MTTTGGWKLGHRPALDGLRGLAVLAVITSHTTPGNSPIRHLGPTGVGVFFVLSGFLITSLLLQEHATTGRVSLGRFYARRARRLLPALAAMVLVIGAIQTALGSSPLVLVPVVGYFGNWIAATGGDMGLMRHTWSLSVEEQFYLGWPLVILAIRGRGARTVAWVAGVGAVASAVWGPVLYATGASVGRVAYGSDTRAVGLLAGCWLAAVMRGSQVRRPRPGVAGVLLAVLAAVSVLPGDVWAAWGAGVAATVVTPLVIWLVAQPGDAGWMSAGILRYVGRRSYAWYLWQSPVLLLVFGFGGRTPAMALLGVAVVVAVGEVSWRFVEAPALSRRRVPNGPVVPQASSAAGL